MACPHIDPVPRKVRDDHRRDVVGEVGADGARGDGGEGKAAPVVEVQPHTVRTRVGGHDVHVTCSAAQRGGPMRGGGVGVRPWWVTGRCTGRATSAAKARCSKPGCRVAGTAGGRARVRAWLLGQEHTCAWHALHPCGRVGGGVRGTTGGVRDWVRAGTQAGRCGLRVRCCNGVRAPWGSAVRRAHQPRAMWGVQVIFRGWVDGWVWGAGGWGGRVGSCRRST